MRRLMKNKRLDTKIFRRTAKKVAAANIPHYAYRGGIRL